jgi:drug/metabolite transporter (DMT)-like permease
MGLKLPFVKRKQTPSPQAFLALMGATAIWGISGPVIKLTLNHLPVVSFLYLRLLIVCILILPFAAIELSKTKINRKDLPNFVILGMLSQTCLLIIFLALYLTKAIDASLIGVTFPMVTLAAGFYFFGEKITKHEKIGVLMASVGAIIVVIEPALGEPWLSKDMFSRMLGNLLAILYEITWLTYIVWSKEVMGEKSKTLHKLFKSLNIPPMSKSYSPFVITAINFYVGLASLLPFMTAEQLGLFGEAFTPHMITPTAIVGVLYMSILSSIVAYLLFQWGLKKAEVSDTGFFRYLGPLFTFPAAYLLLGEVPSKAILLGLVFIVIGVVIAETHRS